MIATCADGSDNSSYGGDGVGDNAPCPIRYPTATSTSCVGDAGTTIHWTIWNLPLVGKLHPIGVVSSRQGPVHQVADNFGLRDNKRRVERTVQTMLSATDVE